MSDEKPAPALAPQLVMWRGDLKDLPPVELPAGYRVRSLEPGDDAHWERIIGESFAWADRAGKFTSIMWSDPEYRPDRVLFICDGDQPVATASAWRRPQHRAHVGYLHYVGVLPDQTGKRLGAWVSLACMHRMVKEGRIAAVLQTDDFRIPAIKTYLKLGFAPMVIDENQRRRWRNVFDVMARPELCEVYGKALGGPLVPFNDPS